MPNFDVIGKSFPRKDAYEKVTGSAAYVADMKLPGMLYGAILHSPVAHARFTKIDTAAARALPGVHTVVTYEDVPDIPYTSCGHPFPFDTPLDMKIFNQHARYVGDTIAAVAAESVEIAREAVRLITFEYEELPAVFTTEEAMKEGAFEIHEGSKNLAGENEFELGDVDAAFAKAAYVFEDVIDTPIVTHSQIETHVSLVEPDFGRDRWILHCSNQVPNILRERITYALGLPMHKLRVVKGYVGGGFGGKQEPIFEIINVLLAMKARRPVMLEVTREECLAMTRTRHADHIRIRSALDENYHFIGRDIELIGNTGAYSSHGHNVVFAQAAHACSTYPCENVRFHGWSVYTNILIAGAQRGYGGPQWHTAMEAHIENICHRLGIDSFDFREKNVAKLGGFFNAAFIENTSSALPEMMAYVRKDSGWDTFDPGDTSGPIKRGLGVAFASYGQSCYPHSVELSAARVIVHEDGFATVFSGATEIGQGTETIFMQIAAEALGIPFEWMLMPDGVDTDTTPFDPGAFASRQTYVAGMAVRKAADACREDILDFAAEDRGFDRSAIKTRQGYIIDRETGERLCPIPELTRKMYYSHPVARAIEHEAYHYPTNNMLTYCISYAVVNVDTMTGQVNVEKLRSFIDCGTVINPQIAKGQLTGGAMMSYGFGLTEQILVDPKTGAVYNDNLLDYKVPTFADVPDLDGGFFESYEPSSAFGNKALGEPPNLCPAAAIRNAVLHATGVEMNRLPLTPERVWEYLHPEEEDKAYV